MKEKQRLDTFLVERGYFPTRAKASAAIMAGLVRVNGEVKDKAGMKIPTDSVVEVTGEPHPYVSRGGLKLEKAITCFNVNFADKIVVDVGASTGGFTDCALQHGAAHVYAVDVGYGQLAWSLRQNRRVTVMERTNFRYVTIEHFNVGIPEIAVIDVSFISVDKILPPLIRILPENGEIVSLIKPQFEAGREHVGKKGIVRDKRIHCSVLLTVLHKAEALGFQVQGLTFSPITGGKGNIEFLVYWKKTNGKLFKDDSLAHYVHTTVMDAHRFFTGDH